MSQILDETGDPILDEAGDTVLDETGDAEVTAPGLGLKAELLLGSTWTDVTDWALPDGSAEATITSGTDDLATDPSPSSLATAWDNPDGRWTWRNASGPYFGQLGIGTRGRVSVTSVDGTRLSVEPDTAPGSCSTPGGTTELTVDTVFVSIDFDLTGYTYPDFTPALAQKAATSGSRLSWRLYLQPDGRPALTVGTVTAGPHYSTATAVASMPVGAGRFCLRASVEQVAGTVHFWTAPEGSVLDPGATWAELGEAQTVGAFDIDSDSSWPLTIAPAMSGAVYQFELAGSGFSGAAANPDFTSLTDGDTTLLDAAGNTWTVDGSAEISGRDWRLQGQLASSSPTTAQSGGAAKTSVQLAGPLQRLQKGPQPPAGSPLRRAIGALSGSLAPVACWPCEDGAGATVLASAVTGVPAMTWIGGPPQLAADSGFPGSDPVVTLNGAALLGRIPAVASPAAVVIRFPWTFGTPPGSGFTVLCRIALSGKISSVSMRYDSTGKPYLVGSGPNVTGFTTVTATSPYGTSWAGQRWMVSIELTPSGGTQMLAIARFTDAKGATAQTDSGLTTGLPGSPRSVRFGPGRDLTDHGVGHVTVQTSLAELSTMVAPLNAYDGEAAGRRFARIASEEGMPCRIYGAPDATVPMGPQSSDPVMTLLDSVQLTDAGLIFETRETFAIAYRTHQSMTYQTASLSVSLGNGEIENAPQGTDDAATLINDWTVSDPQGNSGRAVVDDGTPNSVSVAGRYPNTAAANPADPRALADIAGWKGHVSAADETRFPNVAVNFALLSAGTQARAARMRPGDRIIVPDAPVTVSGTGDVDQLAIGATETLGPGNARTITWNSVPGRPWDVMVLDADDTGRLDTDGSSVHANWTYGSGALAVDTDAGEPLWTTDPADFPFGINASGMRLPVTAISGSSAPQSFTVGAALNGVVKNLTAGDDVRLWITPVLALIGELVTAAQDANAGQKATAALLRSAATLSVIKSVLENRTSTVTPAADLELLLPVKAGQSLVWVSWLMYEGNTNGAGDLNCNFTGPGDIAYTGIGNNLSNAARVNGARTSGNWQFATTGTGNLLSAFFVGSLVASADGELQLNWAQNTSNAVSTVVHEGSMLLAFVSDQ
jgi:hypothetical protein